MNIIKPAHKISIFTVEDNVFFSVMLDKALYNNFNYNVSSFYSAEECLKNINLKPDIIILDYQLPGMNGKEALIRIKALLPNTYVILMSQQKSVDTAIDLIESGAYEYIVKDETGFDKLVNAIERIRKIYEQSYRNSIFF